MRNPNMYVIVNLAHPCGETYLMANGDAPIAYGSVESAAMAQKEIIADPDHGGLHTRETAKMFRLVRVHADVVDAAWANTPDPETYDDEE